MPHAEALLALQHSREAREAVDRYLCACMAEKKKPLVPYSDPFAEIAALEAALIVELAGIYKSATDRSPHTWDPERRSLFAQAIIALFKVAQAAYFALGVGRQPDFTPSTNAIRSTVRQWKSHTK